MIRKNLFLLVSIALLSFALASFTEAYRELNRYAELSAMEKVVYVGFQAVSRHVLHAAVLTPELAEATSQYNVKGLFYTDSMQLFRDLDTLRATVRDSVSVDIANKLYAEISAELSWLLESNVPDSIVQGRSVAHIAALQGIYSLVNAGLARSEEILQHHQYAVADAVSGVRFWMSIFVGLSGVLLVYTTLTQRRSAKQMLKTNEQRFRALVENYDAIIAVLDENFVPFYRTPAAQRLLGYTVEEQKGRSVRDDVHPEDDLSLQKSLEEVKANNGIPYSLSFRVKHRKGHYIWMETIFTNLLKDSAVQGIVMNMRDATERRRAELEIIQVLKEKEATLNRINDSVVSVDSNWLYTFINDAALSTHPSGREQTLGRSIWEVHPQMEGTVFWDKYHEAMGSGQVVEIEDFYAPMNTWFLVKVYPSTDGLTIFYTDITDRKRAEIELRKAAAQESILASIVNSSDDAIISISLDGVITSWNRGAERIFGYTAEHAVGQSISLIIPPDRLAEEPGIPARIAASECIEHYDTERLRMDGSRINVSVTMSPIIDSNKTVIGASKFARDITEQRKAVDKLRASELQYRSLIEHASDAIFIANERGDYNDVNTSACKLVGYTRQELLSMSSKDVIFLEDTIKQLPERLTLLRTGKAEITEVSLKRKDGTRIDVESNAKMLPDGRILAIVRDTTARKRAERQLADTLREVTAYKFALNVANIVAITDQKGLITHVNDNFCKISRYSREELIGQDHRIVNSSFHSKDFIRSIWTTIARGKVWRNEIRNKAKDGTYYWVDTTIVPFMNDDNKPYQYMAIRADVTERKNAEEQLLSSEKRFRALIEHMTDAIVLNDRESNVIYQSPSVTRILGYTLEERRDRPVSTTLHPGYRNEFDELYTTLDKNPGQPFPFQFPFLHKNGHTVWLEGVVTNLLEEPAVNAIVANYRDVTDRKEAEEELIRERTLLRTLIDILPDYIYVKDTEGRFIVNNNADLALMNASSEKEVMGKTAVDVFGAEIGAPFLEGDRQVIRSGLPLVDYEETIKNRKGELRFLLTNKVPLRDSMNNIIGLVGISRDVTKQKQVELALRTSNYFLETAQQVGKIGHWISALGDAGELQWSAETCRIFGLLPYEFDNRLETFFRFIHPDDVAKVNEAVQYAIDNSQTYSIDHRVVLRDGTEKWVHEQGEPTLNEQGKTTGLLGIVQDITQRKEIEHEMLNLNDVLERRVRLRTDELQAANKEMEAFTYSVSHDLRSPLRIIDGFAQILIEDYVSALDDEGQKSLGIIMTNAKKMGQLIDDLLNFSRIGRIEIKKNPVSITDLVNEVILDLRLGGSQIPEHLTIMPMAHACCDRNLIKHVLINLVSNAIKYSSTTSIPQIEIGTMDQDNKVVYYVKDNGAGFDMEYYHKLFGVFQRLHSHDSFSGTGVGLAIVQRIIVRHGGKVWAEAKVNEGATFFFTVD
ncbi:MAG TPA: PAS domain S-box protein [Chryseolinea sp.]|nr:PAS domain S-box protein [Chryseolinea sp.]